jgi:hypothetical protein
VWGHVVASVVGGGDAERIRAHAETSVTGKWDPGWSSGQTINMAAFRAAVRDGVDMTTLTDAQNNALAESWKTLVSGEGYENTNLARQLGFVVGQIQAVGAAVAAATAGGTFDQAAFTARLEAATSAAAAEAAEFAIVTTVVPALRDVVREVLGEDNADQADAIVTRLSERLRPAA